jgi:hypothetical protein
LDNLVGSGKISQSTHDTFNKEIDAAIDDIKAQQKALLNKMDSKMSELMEQIRTLEMLLANFEIQHVSGEVDDEVYQRESELLSMGLEMARHELDTVKDAANQLTIGGPVEQEEMQEHLEEDEVAQPEHPLIEEPAPSEEKEAADIVVESVTECSTCEDEAKEKDEESQKT